MSTDRHYYTTEKKKLKSKMNHGVFFFILLCSFGASLLSRNYEDLTKHVGNLDLFTPVFDPFTKYSLVETVTCLAVYHYIVYNVILHRYIFSLLFGLAVLFGGVYHFTQA